MTKKSDGFTVIELIFVVVIFGLASILFFVQKNNLEIVARDNNRKTAINAMYYALEEVFYPTYKYYPQTISSDNLKSVDPALFKDPNDAAINTAGSTYSYTPINCTNGECKSYTLKTTLENESDFIKTNRNN
jgi:prepilin-type N-terminal cleavage/methylation domain-containing protein